MIQTLLKPRKDRKKSITSTLTILLVLTVIVVSLTSVAVTYTIQFKRSYSELESKADSLINALGDILAIPLWNLDRQNISQIAEAYAHDEIFELLEIRDTNGDIYFNFTRRKREENYPLIKRSAKITYNGETIGNVTLALSTKLLQKLNRQILMTGVGMLLLAVLALSIATSTFFRRVLKRLFYQVDLIAAAYSHGNYDPQKHQILYEEFTPLINILEEMSTALKLRMSEIKEAEKKYRSIFENAVEGIFQTTLEGTFASVNPAFAAMLGFDTPEELIHEISDINLQLYVNEDERRKYLEILEKEKHVFGYDVQFYTKDKMIVWLQLYSRLITKEQNDNVLIEGMALDITTQKQSEAAQKQLEQKLLHAQKMESVGRLAGGVAHDFNNMLGIIIGYSEIILDSIEPDHQDYEKISEINKAAKRSADLTRQLLAFARRQAVAPKVLDLNDIVSGMLKMLKRLLGESITLTWIPENDISLIKIDPSQIDQILANLCINARDAISGQGEIIIETSETYLDDEYIKSHPGSTPGKYVTLSISDNGSGMESDVLNNIFEPFYTTKGIGKGTELGLSTVYGIVQQNNGTIYVYSEPGKGTTFKIYLPALKSAATPTAQLQNSPTVIGNNETVLLVEDEEGLLFLVKSMLIKLGYSVLDTTNTDEALELARMNKDAIELLLTDVIMPELNGKELIKEIRTIIPGLRCLFMSGYTSQVIAKEEMIDGNSSFIQKPFTKQELSQKLQEILQKA